MMKNSSWVSYMNDYWGLLLGMLSSVVDSVEVDGGSTWPYPCGIFT